VFRLAKNPRQPAVGIYKPVEGQILLFSEGDC
jgi:hypothetical protein